MNPLVDEKTTKEADYLIFLLHNKKYAIEAIQVLEVLNLPELTKPQKMAHFLCGLLMYDNILINIVNSYKIFDLPEKKFTITNKLLIIKTEESIFGLIVDNISDLTQLSSQKIYPKTYISENNIIKFLCNHNNELLPVIDVNAIEKYLKINENTFLSTEIEYFETDEISQKIFSKRTFELTERNNKPIAKIYTGTSDYIYFKDCNSNFCIKLNNVKKIINNVQNVTKIPCKSEFVIGTIFYHGEFYTVINLGKFLRFDDDSFPKKEKIIIIEDLEFKIAILVEKIENIIKFSEDEILSIKYNQSENKPILGEIIKENEIYYILNMKNFLSNEKLFIAENI